MDCDWVWIGMGWNGFGPGLEFGACFLVELSQVGDASLFSRVGLSLVLISLIRGSEFISYHLLSLLLTVDSEDLLRPQATDVQFPDVPSSTSRAGCEGHHEEGACVHLKFVAFQTWSILGKSEL